MVESIEESIVLKAGDVVTHSDEPRAMKILAIAGDVAVCGFFRGKEQRRYPVAELKKSDLRPMGVVLS